MRIFNTIQWKWGQNNLSSLVVMKKIEERNCKHDAEELIHFRLKFLCRSGSNLSSWKLEWI